MSESTQVLSEYLSRDELALQLDRTPRTLERWESLRIGPPITRIGKTPYYKKESVLAWLESRERKPTRRGAA